MVDFHQEKRYNNQLYSGKQPDVQRRTVLLLFINEGFTVWTESRLKKQEDRFFISII